MLRFRCADRHLAGLHSHFCHEHRASYGVSYFGRQSQLAARNILVEKCN